MITFPAGDSGEARVRVARHPRPHVPLNGAHLRVPQAAIDDVVRQIVETARPRRVVLFGSYAHGTPVPESDVDLLVVMDTPLPEMEQAIRLCQEIDYHFGLDLIVRTPANLERRLALGDSFLAEALRDGRVLYERTCA